MSKKGFDPERYGPLATMSRACDRMERMLDPGRRWYPEVERQLRQLDYAIRWEMDRLAWEVEFMDRVAADEAIALARRQHRKARRTQAMPSAP